MIIQKKILGIVGIRSGSKGLKNKNIKLLGDKPLVGWILSASKKSKYINRLIVSTDSKKYKKIAEEHKAEVPFLRSKKLSKDNSDEIDFIKDLLKNLKKKENYEPDIIVRLLATSPFQKKYEIDKLINLILKRKYNCGMVISEAKQHPGKAVKIFGNKKKQLVSFIHNNGVSIGQKQNRQEIIKKTGKVYYRSNVIACRTSVIKKFNSLTSDKVGYVIISNKNMVDIDNKQDFEFAEFLINKK